MIRFVLKSAFFLGLVALIFPGGGGSASQPAGGIDVFSTFAGAEAAISDAAGFCGRAPTACDAGGDLARFAGERIGDGLALAYRMVVPAVLGEDAVGNAPVSGTQEASAASTTGAGPSRPEALRDALLTGAIHALGEGRPSAAGSAPSREAATAPGAPVDVQPAQRPLAVRSGVPLPTPRPRAGA